MIHTKAATPARFHKQLRLWRKQGMTHAEIGAMLYVTQEASRHWEHNPHVTPQVKVRRRMAEIIGGAK
jgi:hypothetical protein